MQFKRMSKVDMRFEIWDFRLRIADFGFAKAWGIGKSEMGGRARRARRGKDDNTALSFVVKADECGQSLFCFVSEGRESNVSFHFTQICQMNF
jgi:hypothetical protein